MTVMRSTMSTRQLMTPMITTMSTATLMRRINTATNASMTTTQTMPLKAAMVLTSMAKGR
ncbi:hypothetical protein GCM10023333_13100 [Ferrimonas pelagia]|uniref:Uncharacterized protein n=1 Tax=Ferrimonas pelagia TaxID=1177826 RepID=A0ABP9EKK9_9GAMM